MKTSASTAQGPQVNVQPGSCLDLLRLLLTAAARASRGRAGCPRAARGWDAGVIRGPLPRGARGLMCSGADCRRDGEQRAGARREALGSPLGGWRRCRAPLAGGGEGEGSAVP